MFYSVPKKGQRLRWQSQGDNPVIRYSPGELVFLYCPTEAIGERKWCRAAVGVALYGLRPAEGATLTPPVLIVSMAGHVVAAPICLPELAGEDYQRQWLNHPEPLRIRLILLAPDAGEADVARVVATRHYNYPEWSAWQDADEQLRLRLEALLLDAGPQEAGAVQQAGRELVGRLTALELLDGADCVLPAEHEYVDTMMTAPRTAGWGWDQASR